MHATRGMRTTDPSGSSIFGADMPKLGIFMSGILSPPDPDGSFSVPSGSSTEPSGSE